MTNHSARDAYGGDSPAGWHRSGRGALAVLAGAAPGDLDPTFDGDGHTVVA
jgi:hypothetical protein